MENTRNKRKERIVIAMSGASGAILCVDLLKSLAGFSEIETHLVMTPGAERTLAMETDLSLGEVGALAHRVYDINNIGASIASGTYKTMGMVVVPCSMKTLAGIYSGYSENLLLRAADVTIKERRPLVLVARESPLSPIHLRNMGGLSEMGVVIMPPMLTYYNRPGSLSEMNHHLIGKILDVFDIELDGYARWDGE